MYIIECSDKFLISNKGLTNLAFIDTGGLKMPKTNPIGSVIICLVLLTLIGYAFSRALNLDWGLYFTVAGIILLIAAITGIAAAGGNKS